MAVSDDSKSAQVDPGPWRRIPTQSRSRERVERMLMAAEALLNEGGYEAVSTRAVADRASVSVASLYQFFPDKQAVVAALSRRHLDLFEAIVPSLVDRFPTWQDGVQAALDGFSEFVNGSRAFRELWWAGHLDVATLAAEKRTNVVIAGQLQVFVESSGRSALGPPARPRVAYLIAVEIADRLLELAHRSAPGDRTAVLDEASYLMVHTIERDLAETRGGRSTT